MSNVGRKIKTLVKVVTILGLISCVILFFVGNAAYQEDKDYIEYATANGGAYGYPSLQRAGDNAYNGLQLRNMAFPMAIALLIGSLPLYGFGVLVENSELQSERLSQLIEEQKKANTALNALLQANTTYPSAQRAASKTDNSPFQLPEL